MTTTHSRSNYDIVIMLDTKEVRTNAKTLAINISVDITKGYYDKFPSVKKTLQGVRSKLNNYITHVDTFGNVDVPLNISKYDAQILKDNDYIHISK